MTRVHEILPEWHFDSQHSVMVATDPAYTQKLLWRLDFSGSALMRFLFAIRGLPANMLTLQGMLRHGFLKLADDPGVIVLGVIGKPWHPGGALQSATLDSFRAFTQPGFVKIAWDITFQSLESGGSVVRTSTRVFATSRRARVCFGAYWLVVQPLSGIVRREMLALLREQAAIESVNPANGKMATASSALPGSRRTAL